MSYKPHFNFARRVAARDSRPASPIRVLIRRLTALSPVQFLTAAVLSLPCARGGGSWRALGDSEDFETDAHGTSEFQSSRSGGLMTLITGSSLRARISPATGTVYSTFKIWRRAVWCTGRMSSPPISTAPPLPASYVGGYSAAHQLSREFLREWKSSPHDTPGYPQMQVRTRTHARLHANARAHARTHWQVELLCKPAEQLCSPVSGKTIGKENPTMHANLCDERVVTKRYKKQSFPKLEPRSYGATKARRRARGHEG